MENTRREEYQNRCERNGDEVEVDVSCLQRMLRDDAQGCERPTCSFQEEQRDQDAKRHYDSHVCSTHAASVY